MNNNIPLTQSELMEINKYQEAITKSKKLHKRIKLVLSIIIVAIVFYVSSYEGKYYEENRDDSMGWAILILGPIFLTVVVLTFATISRVFKNIQNKYQMNISRIKLKYYPNDLREEIERCYNKIEGLDTINIIIAILFVIGCIVVLFILGSMDFILIFIVSVSIFSFFYVPFFVINMIKNAYKKRIEKLENSFNLG